VNLERILRLQYTRRDADRKIILTFVILTLNRRFSPRQAGFCTRLPSHLVMLFRFRRNSSAPVLLSTFSARPK
jgi:hypothetical protein